MSFVKGDESERDKKVAKTLGCAFETQEHCMKQFHAKGLWTRSGASFINAYTHEYEGGYKDRRIHNEAFMVNLTHRIVTISVGREF